LFAWFMMNCIGLIPTMPFVDFRAHKYSRMDFSIHPDKNFSSASFVDM